MLNESDTGNSVPAIGSKQPIELRKANKPLMEKRRRARINKSLNELKSILMESMERNSPGHSKWEKADILEMTVQYLHCLRNQRKASKSDPLAVGQFIAGYTECIRQVQKFPLDRTSPFANDVQEKLSDHLLKFLKTFSQDATRNLQNQIATTTPSICPSPPIGAMLGSSSSDGLASNDDSPTSRRSTLSSFASGDESMDSDLDDPHNFEFLIKSNNRLGRKDLNNNSASRSQRMFDQCAGEKERNSMNTVWRPW